MAERIVIHPVTRIEGHAKISIYLDDAGEVESAQFHVTEFRGFEKILRGPPVPRDAGPHVAHLRHLPGEPRARELARPATPSSASRCRAPPCCSAGW